jgi:hypothetical protein
VLSDDPLAWPVGRERQLEAQPIRRSALDADAPDPFVHAAVMMRRAQRRPIPSSSGPPSEWNTMWWLDTARGRQQNQRVEVVVLDPRS